MTNRKINMSPFKLSMLIHFYTSPVPFPRLDTEIYRSTLAEFRALSLIETSGDNIWATTLLGAAWLDAMLNVPTPVQRLAFDQAGEFGGWVNEQQEKRV